MSKKEKPTNVSSAEITATYRSSLPDISGDHLSGKLIGKTGKAKATAFIEKYQYPLAPRKIALSSAFCREQVNRLLATGLYDSVISFASGFSLLNYYIKQDNPSLTDITYYDTDLEYMTQERLTRLPLLKNELDYSALHSIHVKHFDIEQSFKDNVNLRDAFPECNNPIFVCDGVVYFLSEACTHWLIDQTSDYKHSALILYYWHTAMHQQSELFARAFNDLNNGMILETLTCLWDQQMLDYFKAHFSNVQDYTLADYEQKLHETKSIDIQLTDINHYFPIKLLCGEK